MQTEDRIRKLEPPRMSAQEVEMTRVARRCIMEALDRSNAVSIMCASDGDEQPPVAVPPTALKLIGQLLEAMSEGRSVTLVPAKQELTTVEAANFLNVSRPFVIKEIEAGRLPHRMVGTHRRIAFEDLAAYERRMRAKQRKALERMAENERELGLDY